MAGLLPPASRSATACAPLALALVVASAPAAAPKPAHLTLVVIDDAPRRAQPVPRGTTLHLSGVAFDPSTDQQGRVVLPQVAQGRYQLTVLMPGKPCQVAIDVNATRVVYTVIVSARRGKSVCRVLPGGEGPLSAPAPTPAAAAASRDTARAAPRPSAT